MKSFARGKTVFIDSTTAIRPTGGVLKLTDLKLGDPVYVNTVNLAHQLTALPVKKPKPNA